MASNVQGAIEVGFIYEHSAEQAMTELREALGAESDASPIYIETDTTGFKARAGYATGVPDTDDGISIGLEYDELAGENSEDVYKAFIDALKQVYESTEPLYGWGIRRTRIDIPELSTPATSESIADSRIIAPTWVMLFTPAMVEEYGREWLLDLPVDRIDDLPDGGLLIVCTEQLLDVPPGDEYFSDMAEVDRAFGLDPVETGHEVPEI